MFMQNRGYTLLEVIITILLLSMILLTSAVALNALGITNSVGAEDIAYRRNVNKFVEEMQNSVNSLISSQNEIYSGFTNSGLIINELVNFPAYPDNPGIIQNPKIETDENGKVIKKYLATSITMYMTGRTPRRDLDIKRLTEFDLLFDEVAEAEFNGLPDMEVEKKLIQMSPYGLLTMRDMRMKTSGEWEAFNIYDPIKITMPKKTNMEDTRSEIIVVTDGNDKLSYIKIVLLMPTSKEANREFSMVFSCPQEVAVTCSQNISKWYKVTE